MSRLFFLWQRLGIGRYAPATEYVYHLPQLVRAGDTAIDIGANLGYYARTLSRLAGPAGRVYAVEPVAPILARSCAATSAAAANVEILPYALGTENKPITMANDSARETGYFGTGQNFVNDGGASRRRGVHGPDAPRQRTVRQTGTPRLRQMRHRGLRGRGADRDCARCSNASAPRCSIETGGGNRPQIVALFTALGYTGLHPRPRTGNPPDRRKRQGHHLPPAVISIFQFRNMRIDILTVVPELLTSPLNESILHRAQEKGLVQIVVHNLHDYAHDRRKTTDDYPFGGEAGMVMKCEPVFELVEKLQSERPLRRDHLHLARRHPLRPARSQPAFDARQHHHPLRPLQGHRPPHPRTPRHARNLDRRLRADGRRAGGLHHRRFGRAHHSRAPSATKPRPSRTAFRTTCWRLRSTPAPPNSAAGGSPTSCFRATSPRSPAGRRNSPTSAPGSCRPDLLNEE